MKEATGDLSMTAVAVVAIAAVAVVFTTLVWPSIKVNIVNSTKCAQAFKCEDGNGVVKKCQYLDEKGDVQDVNCPDKDGVVGSGS